MGDETRIYSGSKFPNGIKKSRLFEIYLSYRDFGCSPHDYLLDLELIRVQESNGEEICHWFEDEDGRVVVAQINLNGAFQRLEIRENDFELIGAMQKVFISYAKEDRDHARRLFANLKAKGFDPWLDEETLLPGQKWETHILDAIDQCQFFLALLSKKSVGKRGYVQKELRKALDILEKIPEREIFLIPVRLEDCRASHPVLETLHWVDLYDTEATWQKGEAAWQKGFEKICAVLLRKSV